MLFPAQCREEIVLVLNHPVGRGQDKESTGTECYASKQPNFTFYNPFLFSLASLFSFLFWYIIVGGKTVLHLIGIISST